jgi:hypothetical protein
VSVIAILDSGERVPVTDGWDEARRLFKAGDYSADVVRLEFSETPGSASPDDTERTQACMEGL